MLRRISGSFPLITLIAAGFWLQIFHHPVCCVSQKWTMGMAGVSGEFRTFVAGTKTNGYGRPDRVHAQERSVAGIIIYNT